MKKILFLLAMLPMLVFTACSDDDEDVFNYPMETLYGTWEGIEIDLKEGKIDLTNWYYSKYRFSATFNPNGTHITTANDTIIQGIMCSNDSAIKPLTITEKPPGMAWVVILSLTIRMII